MMARTTAARLAAGALVWTFLLGWTGRLLTVDRPAGGSTLGAIWSHFRRQEAEFPVRFERPVLLEVGDAVLVEGGKGRQVGEVAALLDEEGRPLAWLYGRVAAARIVVFDRADPGLRADARIRLDVVPETAGLWIWNTLINERTAARIREIWKDRGPLRHGREVLELLSPVLQGVLADTEKTIEEEGRVFLERHRPEVERLVRKAEEALGREKLAGLFESDIWPILRVRIQPVIDAIGAEVWDRVPLWAFTWSVVYQSLPLTRDDHFKKRWERFVEDEVLPIFKSHARELAGVSRDVARDTLSNPRVAAFLREAIVHLLSDPELHRLGYAFLDEVFVQNPRFRDRIQKRWKSPEAEKAMRRLAERLEPVMREIGDVLLGTREEGITPEFARVLRAQVLEKDRQRLVVHPGSAGKPLLAPGSPLSATVTVEEPR